MRGALGPVNSSHDLLRKLRRVVSKRTQLLDHVRIGCGDRVGPGGVRVEAITATFSQDGFGHDRTGRVVGAQKQHVEGGGHPLVLLRQRGEKPRQVPAEFGTAAAAGFGEEAEQLPHPGHACGMHDLSAVAGGMGEARAFQRCEVEGQGRGRDTQAAGDVAGREAVWAFAHQQAQEVEPCLLRQGGEGRSGFCRFHISSIIEI